MIDGWNNIGKLLPEPVPVVGVTLPLPQPKCIRLDVDGPKRAILFVGSIHYPKNFSAFRMNNAS
jgi:hypothetical protein